MTSEARHECLRSPLAERCVGSQTFAARAASPQRRHVGLHTRFIDEDKPRRLSAHEGLAPFTPLTPRRIDIGAFFLRRQQRFFYM